MIVDEGIDPAIAVALDEVFGDPSEEDRVLFTRLRALVTNVLHDNYNPIDVRPVIELAKPAEDAVVPYGDDG